MEGNIVSQLVRFAVAGAAGMVVFGTGSLLLGRNPTFWAMLRWLPGEDAAAFAVIWTIGVGAALLVAHGPARPLKSRVIGPAAIAAVIAGLTAFLLNSQPFVSRPVVALIGCEPGEVPIWFGFLTGFAGAGLAVGIRRKSWLIAVLAAVGAVAGGAKLTFLLVHVLPQVRPWELSMVVWGVLTGLGVGLGTGLAVAFVDFISRRRREPVGLYSP